MILRSTTPQRLRALLFSTAIALLALAPIGCSDDDGQGPDRGEEGQRCEERADCSGGLACIDGLCASCGSDGDCAFIERCNAASLICEFRPGWGDECSAHADCVLGSSCSQGLCMPSSMTVECGARNQCPEGMRCNRELQVCEEDLGCKEDLDCNSGEVCNVGTGQCVLGCTAETEALVCAVNEHCSNGQCVECESDEECSGGFTCNLEAGRCVGANTCFTDRGCPAGLICNRATRTCTEPPPPCLHDGNCLSTEYCDLRRQVCALRECTGDQDSPNGSLEEAVTLHSGLRTDLRVCEGEEKWYKIDLLRGDRINIRIQSDVLQGAALNAQLRDPIGAVLSEDPYILDATVGVDGTYYLVIRTIDAHVNYNLSVLVSKGEPCDDDRHAGNNTVVLAAPLEPGMHASLVSCPSSLDFYVVEVPPGEGVEVTLQHDPLQGLLDLVLRDSDGQSQLDIDTSIEGEKTVRTDSVKQGRAYILVYSPDPRVKNTYDLVVTRF